MDALDLIEHINYNGGKQVDYAYNKTGDLVKMEDWSGTTTYEVDLLHQLTATTDRLGKHVAYTYDGVGNQTSVSYPDGTIATKEYDLVHNLTTVIEEDGRTTSYTYDGMRRVTHMDYPDGWQEDYHYDSIGQLLAIEDTDPTQKDMKQQKNTFEYDVCGNMIHEYMRGNGTGETTTDVTYTYDELHRVTSAKELYGNAWRNYQYDSLSNLTWEDNSNLVHYDYKLNNLNQVTEKHYSTNDKEGTVYTYDKRGNLVKEEYGKLNGNPNGQKRQTVAEYTYDETNKMVKGVNSIGESSSYLFNGRNALVEQIWHIAKNGYGYHDIDAGIEDPADTTNGKGGNGSSGKGHGNGNGQGNGNGSGDKPTGTTVGDFSTVVKQFVIDYTVETMDPLMEHEVNGLDYRYVYGNERLSVNISPIPNGAGHIVESGTVGQQIRLYYHQDLRGTVDYLTSPVSQKVESWTHYNEWGEITHNAVLKTGYRELDLVKNYTGHDFDAVLNMYYAKARMYDAENRRFVALDPAMDGSKYDISVQVNNTIMFVQYLYVADNPLRYIDVLGMFLPGTVLREGAMGNDVYSVNLFLLSEGLMTYDEFQFNMDTYTKYTSRGIKKVQEKHELPQTGKVDLYTWEAMGHTTNTKLEQEFWSGKLGNDIISLSIEEDTITIDYFPKIYVCEEITNTKKMLWFDYNYTTYEAVSDVLYEKYVERMVAGIKQWEKEAVDIQGITAKVIVNVTPTKADTISDANIIYKPNVDKNNITPTTPYWNYKNDPLIRIEAVPTNEQYYNGVDMLANMTSHEFGHVLGLWDAYGYEDHTNNEIVKWLARHFLSEAPPEVMIEYGGNVIQGIDQITTHSVMNSEWGVVYEYDSLLYEMMLYAWSTNSLQAFTPILFKPESSQALYH